jgi:hypothetical protein
VLLEIEVNAFKFTSSIAAIALVPSGRKVADKSTGNDRYESKLHGGLIVSYIRVDEKIRLVRYDVFMLNVYSMY